MARQVNLGQTDLIRILLSVGVDAPLDGVAYYRHTGRYHGHQKRPEGTGARD